MFSLDSLNLVIFVITVNWFEPTTSCAKDQDITTVPVRHISDRIFKLIPIHGSVI